MFVYIYTMCLAYIHIYQCVYLFGQHLSFVNNSIMQSIYMNKSMYSSINMSIFVCTVVYK